LRGSPWRRHQFLKRHTVVVLLGLPGDKPNQDESARLAELEGEIDAQLAVSSLDAPYYGRYEGHEINNGEYRMFIGCPDAGLLVQEILRLLGRLNWKGGVRVVKRYGEMREAPAREETIDVS
jgi:hypothetical protein